MELSLNPGLDAVVKEIAKPGIGEIADAGVEDAKAHAAVETGEMQGTIHKEETEDGWQVVVGTDHWVFNEFGTIFQEARPFMRTLIDDLGLQR